jgi:hypothetical protein
LCLRLGATGVPERQIAKTAKTAKTAEIAKIEN